ncbi:MAG: peptidylprolyl isomerase, partial [bacterium]
MRKIYGLGIFIAFFVMMICLLVGCETPAAKEPAKNPGDITAGELKKVMLASMPPQSDVYNVVINRVLLPRLSKIGYLKEYHEAALNKLDEIRDKIIKGEMTFEEAQEKYSDDPGKKDKLLYEDISEGMFIPEFDEIMFDIPFNEVSESFLSEFGVHILRVDDAKVDEDGKRTSVNVRHVLLDWKQFIDPNNEDPKAMEKLNLNFQKDTDVQVFDKRIQTLLPGLGKKNEEQDEEKKAETTENSVNGELEEITDPDGVILTINSIPVTKAELDKWVKKIAPKE